MIPTYTIILKYKSKSCGLCFWCVIFVWESVNIVDCVKTQRSPRNREIYKMKWETITSERRQHPRIHCTQRLQKHLRLSHWCSCIRICNRICHLAEGRGLQERQCCVKALKTFPILHNVTVFVYLFYSTCVLMYLCNCICERQCCAKALKTFPP